MVVIDHHSYGSYDPERSAATVLASTIVAIDELNYNTGPDYHDGYWGYKHSMTLTTEDWEQLLRRPYLGTLSEQGISAQGLVGRILS